MGRSRGGLITKINALSDPRGLSIRFAITPDQGHDGEAAEDSPDRLTKSCIVLADRSYDADWIRDRMK